jgi:hypothetical protein
VKRGLIDPGRLEEFRGLTGYKIVAGELMRLVSVLP